MNAIYFFRLVVLIGSFGLVSPLLAEPPRDPTQPVTTSRESHSVDSAHPGEKVAEVDLRSLPTSGTDAKFQGTLLNLGVKSIQEVKPLEQKTGDDAQKVQTNAVTASKDAGEKEHKANGKEKPPSLPDQAKASPATNR